MVQVGTMSKGKVNGIKETWRGEMPWFSGFSALGAEGRVFESRRPDQPGDPAGVRNAGENLSSLEDGDAVG